MTALGVSCEAADTRLSILRKDEDDGTGSGGVLAGALGQSAAVNVPIFHEGGAAEEEDSSRAGGQQQQQDSTTDGGLFCCLVSLIRKRTHKHRDRQTHKHTNRQR